MSIKSWLGMEVNEVDRAERNAVINLHMEELNSHAFSLKYNFLREQEKKTALKHINAIECELIRIKQLLSV